MLGLRGLGEYRRSQSDNEPAIQDDHCIEDGLLGPRLVWNEYWNRVVYDRNGTSYPPTVFEWKEVNEGQVGQYIGRLGSSVVTARHLSRVSTQVL